MRLAIPLSLLLGLAACGTPSQAQLTFQGDDNLNPNPEKQSTNLTVLVYPLKSDQAWNGMASLDEAFSPQNAMKILGASAAKEPISIVVRPGQASPPLPIEWPEGVKFLGILGQFMEEDGTGWRQVVPVDAAGDKTLYCVGYRIEVRDLP